MGDSARRGFAVRPRTLLIAIAVVLVLVGFGLWFYLTAPYHPGRVRLSGLSEDATATVSFAGMIPAADDDPLANPLGIVWEGERFYVAESDAGRILILDSAGGRIGAIGIPPAEGRQVAYPSSVAVAGEGMLAVVDNAGERVVLVPARRAQVAEVSAVLRPEGDGVWQPTAVASGGGELYVYDAATACIQVFDLEGEYVRTIAEDIAPRLTVVSGMCLSGDSLIVADGNASRVLVIDAESGRQESSFADRFGLPRGVAAMDGGRTAVVDTLERAVVIVGAGRASEDVIDTDTVPDGPLESARGVAWLSEDRRLYVADSMAGRIMVYNVRLPEEEK